jgi:hypothetical protein
MVQFNSGGSQFSSYPHYIAITYIYIIEMPDDMIIYNDYICHPIPRHGSNVDVLFPLIFIEGFLQKAPKKNR